MRKLPICRIVFCVSAPGLSAQSTAASLPPRSAELAENWKLVSARDVSAGRKAHTVSSSQTVKERFDRPSNAFSIRSYAFNTCVGAVQRTSSPLFGASQTQSCQNAKGANAQSCLYVIDYKFVNHREIRFHEPGNIPFKRGRQVSC